MTSHKQCTHPATKADRAKCRKAQQASLAKIHKIATEMRAAEDKKNTVVVGGKKVVIPRDMAFELRKPNPHPRHLFPGEFYPAMTARQQLRFKVAQLLGIRVADVPIVIKQLRRQSR